MDTQTLDAKARLLEGEAREHMRLSRQHRKLASWRYRQLNELINAARKRGIHITVNDTQPQGGPSGNHNTSTTTNQAQD